LTGRRKEQYGERNRKKGGISLHLFYSPEKGKREGGRVLSRGSPGAASSRDSKEPLHRGEERREGSFIFCSLRGGKNDWLLFLLEGETEKRKESSSSFPQKKRKKVVQATRPEEGREGGKEPLSILMREEKGVQLVETGDELLMGEKGKGFFSFRERGEKKVPLLSRRGERKEG